MALTTPAQARSLISGRIYQGTAANPADLAAIAHSRHVTQSILVEGRHQLRLFEPEGDAPAGFLPVEPSLEDAYFVLTREDVGRELPA